jgi:5-methyltetrahydropteroyltriglutamate--homocysteine methyltransferase
MKLSTERTLVTHVGSMPRPQNVVNMLFAQERGDPYDEAEFDAVMTAAVAETVQKQVDAGVDVVSDGEMSKISYATYIKYRLTGFAGDSARATPLDLDEFPAYRDKLASAGGTPKYSRPRCQAPISVKDLSSLEKDIANLIAARDAAGAAEAFMNAASPGVIGVFQPNDYYSTHEAYLQAVADAMKQEYEMIAASGVILQIDSPDLAMGRHIQYRDETDEQFVMHAEQQVEVLNYALQNVPAEQIRMHLCWGNYEGPHTHDIPLEKIINTVLKVKPQALLFEASNPRHAHEWTVWADADIPDDKVLIPGVIDSTTNYVEHPQLVAERLLRFADIVGRERVLAGSDCGFGTFAGFGAVHPDIAYAKLGVLAEGAQMASDKLWS